MPERGSTTTKCCSAVSNSNSALYAKNGFALPMVKGMPKRYTASTIGRYNPAVKRLPTMMPPIEVCAFLSDCAMAIWSDAASSLKCFAVYRAGFTLHEGRCRLVVRVQFRASRLAKTVPTSFSSRRLVDIITPRFPTTRSISTISGWHESTEVLQPSNRLGVSLMGSFASPFLNCVTRS